MAETGAPAVDSKPKSDKLDSSIYPAQVGGAIKYRNKGGRLTRWKDYARICAYNYNGDNKTDSPVVNLMAARSRAMSPLLAFNDPVFDVTYKGELPTLNSEAALSLVLEQIWVDEQVGDVFKRGIDDWPMLGRGIFFVGFEAADEGDIVDAKRAESDARQTIEKQVAGRSVVDRVRQMFKKGDKPLDPPSEVKTLKMMLEQRIFVERVSPFDYVIDPCSTGVHDATFMARRLFLPLERAKLMFGADCPTADSVANVAIYTDESESEPWGKENKATDEFPESVRRVEAWENWNITTRQTCYIDVAGKVLGEASDWKSPHPGWPFVVLDWDPVTDCPYPEGICASLHTLNNELNEMRKRELAEMGKAFRRYVVPDTISPEGEKALTDATDGGFVKLKVDETVSPIVDQPLPADIWGLENRIMANADEVSRTSAQMSGGTTPTARSATETSIRNSGVEASMAYRQLQVEQAAAQIAERMAAIIFVTYDEPVTVRIVNSDAGMTGEVEYEDGTAATDDPIPVGELIDYPFIGVDHAGYVRVKVTSGSMASVAKDVERNQFGQLVQLYGNDQFFDRQAAFMHHAGMFSSIKDPSKFILKPEQQPQPEAPVAPQPGMVDPALQQPQPGMPMDPAAMGMGSGNPEADMLAATMGAIAPGAGVNGFPGPAGPPLMQ